VVVIAGGAAWHGRRIVWRRLDAAASTKKAQRPSGRWVETPGCAPWQLRCRM